MYLTPEQLAINKVKENLSVAKTLTVSECTFEICDRIETAYRKWDETPKKCMVFSENGFIVFVKYK